MTTNGSPSAFVICATLTMAIISALQLFREKLVTSSTLVILSGYAGTLIFVLTLLSITHLQIIFKKNPVKWQIPTVAFSLGLGCFATSLVHSISVWSCVLFSMIALYFIVKFYNFPSFCKPKPHVCKKHQHVKAD